MLGEVLAWRVLGIVRTIDSDSEEERFFVPGPQLPNCPSRDLTVFGDVCLEVQGSPVPVVVDAVPMGPDQEGSHGQLDGLGRKTLVPCIRLPESAAASVRRAFGSGKSPAPTSVIGVKYLARRRSEVAVAAEKLRDGL